MMIDWLHRHKLLVVIGCFSALVVALLAACPGYLQSRYDQKLAREQATIAAIAQHLGASNSQLLAQYMCRSMFDRRCGSVRIYETPLSIDQIQQSLPILGWGNWGYTSADGNGIFTELNIHAGQSLTVNGNNGGNVNALQLPSAIQFEKYKYKNQDIFIIIYDIKSSPDTYQINNKAIGSNIITITVLEE